MSMNWKRRGLLKGAGAVFGAGLLPLGEPFTLGERPYTASSSPQVIHLSLNENPYGPSPYVAQAIRAEFSRLYRYADKQAAQQLAEQVAHYEQVPMEQVVLRHPRCVGPLSWDKRWAWRGVHLLEPWVSRAY